MNKELNKLMSTLNSLNLKSESNDVFNLKTKYAQEDLIEWREGEQREQLVSSIQQHLESKLDEEMQKVSSMSLTELIKYLEQMEIQ